MKQVFKTVFVVAITMFITGCGNNAGSSSTESDVWVDLGLPSGLLWATYNIGAIMPEDFGGHFAWGETTAKISYNWTNYAHGDAYDRLAKYCSLSENGLNGFTDTLTILQEIDDIATERLGREARIPTAIEWQELIDNTESKWTEKNGIHGRLFTAPNGNYIFLPAAGWFWGLASSNKYSNGYYWSSSLVENNPCEACYFYFDSDEQGLHDEYGELRCGGLSIRAVCDK